MLCACVLSHADVQAVVVWLFRGLRCLCEQSEQVEASSQCADIARAVLSGEFMAGFWVQFVDQLLL